jgi:hypothetical protein
LRKEPCHPLDEGSVSAASLRARRGVVLCRMWAEGLHEEQAPYATSHARARVGAAPLAWRNPLLSRQSQDGGRRKGIAKRAFLVFLGSSGPWAGGGRVRGRLCSRCRRRSTSFVWQARARDSPD